MRELVSYSYEKCSFVSRQRKISTEHIDSKCSLESELFFMSIYSIRIRSTARDIKPFIKPYVRSNKSVASEPTLPPP